METFAFWGPWVAVFLLFAPAFGALFFLPLAVALLCGLWGCLSWMRSRVTRDQVLEGIDRKYETNGLLRVALAVEQGAAAGHTRYGRYVEQTACEALEKGAFRAVGPFDWPLRSFLFACLCGVGLLGFTLRSGVHEEHKNGASGLNDALQTGLLADMQGIEKVLEEEALSVTERETLDALLEGVAGVVESGRTNTQRRASAALASSYLKEPVSDGGVPRKDVGPDSGSAELAALADLLAGLGEAAAYEGGVDPAALEEHLRMAEDALAELDARTAAESVENGEQRENNADDPGSEEPEPGTSQKSPEDEKEQRATSEPASDSPVSSEDARKKEEGEAGEQVLAREERRGAGQEQRGDGALPSEILEEESAAAGTTSRFGETGGEERSDTQAAALKGGGQMANVESRSSLAAASEFVETQWRGDPEGLIRTMAMEPNNPAQVKDLETVHSHYRSIAEENMRGDAIPSTRRAYIRNYFEQLQWKREESE